MKETIGFIGLGGMGLAMATHLLRAGFGLRIYRELRRRRAGLRLACLIHERLTATVAKGRENIDWAGFAREVSESAGL